MTMFNKTLLGSAVLAAMMATSANAAIPLAGDAVQVYGQATGAIMVDSHKTKDSAMNVDVESRIGFRGVVEFDSLSPNLVWQIEGGNANGAAGAFGVRDTFVGLDFESVGSIKWGRQLVAAYNYVDWPHSNPGLGNVFDWNNDLGVAYQDRASNTIRFDSVSMGGLGIQATIGGMENTTDSLVASIAANYNGDGYSVHGGYYSRGEYTVKGTVDKPLIADPTDPTSLIPNPDYGKDTTTPYYASSYAIIGGNVALGDVTLTAAYKHMMADTQTGDSTQGAFSATAQYVNNGTWLYKAGFAMTTDAEIDGKDKKESGDMALTARVGYLLPSAIIYSDIRHYDMNGNLEGDDMTRFMLGIEYYF